MGPQKYMQPARVGMCRDRGVAIRVGLRRQGCCQKNMALGSIFLTFLYGLEMVKGGFSKIWMRGKSCVTKR